MLRSLVNGVLSNRGGGTRGGYGGTRGGYGGGMSRGAGGMGGATRGGGMGSAVGLASRFLRRR